MMINKQYEEQLRDPVRAYFLKQQYQVFDEVRLFSRDIDLIAKKRRKLIAIELKIHDWKKAVHQAKLNMRVSDYSYIALPENYLGRANRKMYHEILRNGIGLIGVNRNAYVVMKPVKSDKIQRSLRKKFLAKMQEVENEDV